MEDNEIEDILNKKMMEAYSFNILSHHVFINTPVKSKDLFLYDPDDDFDCENCEKYDECKGKSCEN